MSTLQTIQAYSTKLEDVIDKATHPIKPYIPILARFLLIVTFLEDALRITMQWPEQRWYLEQHMGFPRGISHLFLGGNVIVMALASSAVLAKRYVEHAIFALLGVIVVQSIGYGLLFDKNFFLRNLSVIGGLLMLLSDAWRNSKKRDFFAGLPSLSETERSTYSQLAGRVLLVFLFFGLMFGGELSFFRVLMSLFGLAACIMVVVGFKAKSSALLLVLILSFVNFILNNWWTLHEHHPERDFLKYDFFQTLSIMGGKSPFTLHSCPCPVLIPEKVS